MSRIQNVSLEMFRRVLKFLETYQSRFPEGASAPLLAELSAIVDAWEVDAAMNVANRREGRDATRAAREVLKQHIDAIARMARAIATRTPGFDARFVRPRSSGHSIVLNSARAYLSALEEQSAVFVANGMPADLVTTLRTALERVETAAGTRDAGKLARASAGAGMRRGMKNGRAVVTKIDALVRYHFANDPEVLAAWTRARLLEGLPSRRVAGEVDAPPVTSPAVTPSPNASVSTVIDPAA